MRCLGECLQWLSILEAGWHGPLKLLLQRHGSLYGFEPISIGSSNPVKSRPTPRGYSGISMFPLASPFDCLILARLLHHILYPVSSACHSGTGVRRRLLSGLKAFLGVMAPRPASAHYTAYLLSLISSTTYPPLPNLEELEALQSAIQAQSSSSSPIFRDEEKKARKERKRKEREEAEERAALEANEKTGLKLEALERARLGRITGSPAVVRIKKERSGQSSLCTGEFC